MSLISFIFVINNWNIREGKQVEMTPLMKSVLFMINSVKSQNETGVEYMSDVIRNLDTIQSIYFGVIILYFLVSLMQNFRSLITLSVITPILTYTVAQNAV